MASILERVLVAWDRPHNGCAVLAVSGKLVEEFHQKPIIWIDVLPRPHENGLWVWEAIELDGKHYKGTYRRPTLSEIASYVANAPVWEKVA